MLQQLFYTQLINHEKALFDDVESHHLLKVMRARPGQQIMATDGKGNLYEGALEVNGKSCHLVSLQLIREVDPPRPKCHLLISPTKNQDRLEWMVEKVTEIGIDTITFILCERTERSKLNMERLSKKVISAMKQSRRLWLPKLNPPQPLTSVLVNPQNAYIAHLEDPNTPHLYESLQMAPEWNVLIGPEGDFTSSEIAQCSEQNVQAVSLGSTVLRTETAGVVAAELMSLRRDLPHH